MNRLTLLSTIFAFMILTSSCSSSQQDGQNPLLSEWDTPFGVPPFDEIKPRHYLPALEVAIAEQNEELKAIVESEATPSFESVILPYDNSGKRLSDICNIFGLITSAETNDELQLLSETVWPMVTVHASNISLDEALFAKIKTAYEYRHEEKLDAEQLRLTEKIYTSFVRGGALLSTEQKSRMQAISEELSLLDVRFSQNLLSENNKFHLELTLDELDGLPTSVRSSAKETAQRMGIEDKWVFNLKWSSWIPFLTYSKKRDLREKLYKAYLSRGNNGDENDNNQIINDIVRLRVEQAHLLGYESYADYVISDQMASKVANAYELLEDIWEPALEGAKEELAVLEEKFKRDHPDGVFESWDWWYYAEIVRKEQYDFDEEMVRPYLSLSNVQSGIFAFANRLYGITFRPIAVPHYHEECSAYEVLDVDNSHIGVLYFDLFPRPGKSQGAWCGNFRDQIYENGERVAPVVSIVTNFSRPVGRTPSLLNIDETKTLFHEFGHALHFLFHDVKYRGLSAVEGDFVELPSQILENWAMEPAMLSQYAFHYKSNKPMPSSLVEKLRRSTLFNQGFATTELIAAALSDLDIHSITEYEPFNVSAFERDALAVRRGLIPQIEPRYHYGYFGHIFGGGYAAGYYFYLWAEVLDKDAFAAFKESGDLFNKRLADSFRRNILERGGSEDGMTMYTKFRGAEPSKDGMLYARGLKKPEVEVVDQEVVVDETHDKDIIKE